MTQLEPPLPRELQIEVTAACNLRCRMCLVSYRPPVNKSAGAMPYKRFQALIDDLPGLERLTLQGLGEPLLVPHLVPMVEYAATRGIAVGFNTNGMLLSADRARRLIEAGLSWLHVSVDGATARTYESIRDRASFAVVSRNVARLAELRHELGSTTPWLQVVFVAMRRNVAELPDLVRLASGWGVDSVRVQNLSHSFSDTDPAGSYRPIREFTAAEALWLRPVEAAEPPAADDAQHIARAFAAAEAVAAEAGVELRLPQTNPPVAPRAAGQPGCGWPWGASYINHDGTVQPCCMVMGADRAVLGDAGVAGFRAVWHGEAYRRFRLQLLGDQPPVVCAGCSLYRRVF